MVKLMPEVKNMVKDGWLNLMVMCMTAIGKKIKGMDMVHMEQI